MPDPTAGITGHSPNQSPKNGHSQEESHDASYPHSWNYGRVGVKGEIQGLIHPSVRSSLTLEDDGQQRKQIFFWEAEFECFLSRSSGRSWLTASGIGIS